MDLLNDALEDFRVGTEVHEKPPARPENVGDIDAVWALLDAGLATHASINLIYLPG